MYPINYARFTKTDTRTIPDGYPLKTVKRTVKYDDHSLNSSIEAAARMSLAYNLVYIITPTAYGYRISHEGKYAVCNAFYRVSGRTVEVYEQFVAAKE